MHVRTNIKKSVESSLHNFWNLSEHTAYKAHLYVVHKPQYGRPSPPQHPWLSVRETLARIYDDELAFRVPPWEPPDCEPIECELANGHMLKIKATYWLSCDFEQILSNFPASTYFSIRIYCTENCLPKRLHRCEEFRAGVDFHVSNFDEIWQWLRTLTQSRDIFDYDSFDEFISDLADYMGISYTAEVDTVSHLEDLAWVSAPKWFDCVDDSIFNDQTG